MSNVFILNYITSLHSNMFIVSLAVADVIVGIIVMPVSAFYIFSEKWVLGIAVCQVNWKHHLSI